MLGIPGAIKNVARQVTLELIYEAVDERTRAIREDIKDLRQSVNQINVRIDQLYHLYAEFLRDQRRGR
jgi:hypothetical protein